MEKELANGSGPVLTTGSPGYSAITVSALVSLVLLLSVVVWRASGLGTSVVTFTAAPGNALENAAPLATSDDFSQHLLTTRDTPLAAGTSTVPDPDGIRSIGNDVMGQLVGTYVVLKQNGSYTKAEGEEVAGTIAEYMRAQVSYERFEKGDLMTTPDISYERMLAYRADLRESLAPLLENTEPEFEVFGRYVETNDPKYLAELKEIAGRYREAIAQTAAVVAPTDFAHYQLAVLNSLQEFATTLEYMAENADDAFASLALLRTYNSAEASLLNSFNSLALAQANKSK